jgi:membrane protease subunit (stomatin/prohibitin family)
MPKDLLNKANKLMRTANNTAWNVRSTQRNLNSLTQNSQNKKQQKAAQKALDWECACGKKNTSKFCETCGNAKPACPNCGAAPTGSKFCGNCGTPMN